MRRKILLAVAAATFLLYFLRQRPATEQIVEPATEVQEITLKVDAVGGEGLRGPVVDLGYLLWVNFPRVVYRGETFYQVGSGSSLIRKDARPTRYEVHQGFRKQWGVFGETRYATLEVRDEHAGQAVALKEWQCDRTECRTSRDDPEGWPGQHGALFVRRALNPTLGIGGAIGTKPYPKTVATTVWTEPTKALDLKTLKARTLNCGSDVDVAVRRDLNKMALSTASWSFIAAHQIRQVHCSAAGYLVFSTTFPEDVFVDWLSRDGTLLGQYTFGTRQFPTDGGGTFPFMAEVDFTPDAIRLRMNYLHRTWPSGEHDRVMPQWEVNAEILTKKSAGKHAL